MAKKVNIGKKATKKVIKTRRLFSPQEKLEAVILLHEKYDGSIKKASEELGIKHDTLTDWSAKFTLVEKTAVAKHLMEFDLKDLNKRQIDYHNGEMIQKVSEMEHELIDKMRIMITEINKPSELKYLNDMWKTLTDRMLSVQGKVEVNVDNSTVNNSQSNYYNSVTEATKQATLIKLSNKE